ncbi:hypothetical protein D3C72_2060390 [compost metagenome]
MLRRGLADRVQQVGAAAADLAPQVDQPVGGALLRDRGGQLLQALHRLAVGRHHEILEGRRRRAAQLERQLLGTRGHDVWLTCRCGQQWGSRYFRYRSLAR